MKCSIICWLFFLNAIISMLSAQNYVDLGRAYYSFSPSVAYDSTSHKTNISNSGIDITLPILLKNDNALLTGLSYENIQLAVVPGDKTIVLQSGTVKLGLNLNHSEKLTGTYLMLPKFSGDFSRKSNHNFQLGGLALWNLKKNEHFKYRIGLYYNTETFGPFYAPLLGCYFKKKKIEVNATLPVYCDVNYQWSKRFITGIDFSAITKSYYVGNHSPALQNMGVVRASNELFGYTMLGITENIFFKLKAGYAIGRNYQAFLYSDKLTSQVSAFKFGDDRTLLNADVTDGFIAMVDLRYRFWIKKD